MASSETRSRLRIRVDAVRRLVLWHVLSGVTPYYLVSEFPKSGGSWVAQMLSAYLDVPFPRNKDVTVIRRQPSILHGHHLYSKHFKNAVYVLRDGRDVMVSAYFHMLFQNDRNPPWAIDRIRAELAFSDYDDVEGNLPQFIEYMFTKFSSGLFHFSWADFVYSVGGKNANCIRYEDLLEDTPGTFAAALARLNGREPEMERVREIAERFSFRQQTKRNAGEEDTTSFLRKGIAGDWLNKFTSEARQAFDKYAGEALLVAGYEKNRDWVAGHGT